jgi:transitional endoplasmic reticulum ATPase
LEPEILETLLEALALSPDNVVLRRQVTEELLKARRWGDLDKAARPLLETPHRALAQVALARAALAAGDRDTAQRLYQEAIRADRRVIDEGLEAELEPEEALRVPTIEYDDHADPVRPDSRDQITFDDVGGMTAVKEQIRLKIIHPFRQPELYAAYGKKIGGGILMYGPPGCGKTYLARATAGELGVRFFILSLDEILSMWLGQTEKQLAAIFSTARTASPSVLFIDEVDALGARRADIQNSSIRMMVSQLLVEMDGINAKKDSLLVLAATNTPWAVDPALRRPGRFDRVLFVPPPDAQAREEILRLHARGRKIDPDIPWPALAQKTEFFSGADLEHLVEQATEGAVADALRTGRMRDVNFQDFRKALTEVKPSTVEWLRRARNYVNYSNQDGTYDDLAQYLEKVRLR